jgi:predicted transcriptional regulator
VIKLALRVSTETHRRVKILAAAEEKTPGEVITGPVEDRFSELSEEELRGIEEGRNAIREGRVIPFEQAAMELGI